MLTAGVLAISVVAEALSQATVLEVLPLRYRNAQEVIPVLQPLLGRDGSISGMQSQLIVRTTPANLEEIKRVLASIDTAPRQLLITVRQDADVDSNRVAGEVSGSVGGEHGRVTIPGSREHSGGNVVIREGDNRIRGRVIDERSAGSERSAHSVRTLEGREAFIQAGQSVPIRERQVRRTGVGGQVVEQVVDTTQYRDVTSGFYVRARLSGDRVTLDVRPQQESLSRQPTGAVNVQSMVTTVSGRLGEWMDIGGVSQSSSGQEAVLLGRSVTGSRDERRVQVRVEEIR